MTEGFRRVAEELVDTGQDPALSIEIMKLDRLTRIAEALEGTQAELIDANTNLDAILQAMEAVIDYSKPDSGALIVSGNMRTY